MLVSLLVKIGLLELQSARQNLLGLMARPAPTQLQSRSVLAKSSDEVGPSWPRENGTISATIQQSMPMP